MTNLVLTAILLSVGTNWFDKLPEPNGREPEYKQRNQVVTLTYAVHVPSFGWMTNSITKTNTTLLKRKPTIER